MLASFIDWSRLGPLATSAGRTPSEKCRFSGCLTRPPGGRSAWEFQNCAKPQRSDGEVSVHEPLERLGWPDLTLLYSCYLSHRQTA